MTSTGCVTPGPLYVVTAAGNQVQLPLSDPEAECNYVFTYRDTIGIVRVLAHPTPDAPRTYSYTYDEQGGPCSTTCYENQWSELSLRWDPPPTPQNPRCPPTGNGILDNEETTGDTLVRFTMNIDSLSGPCQRGFSFTAQSGYDLIAIFHTHPFAPGTRTAPDASCGWKVGEEVPSMARGYSPGDWKSHKSYDDVWKQAGDSTEALSFVINKDEVFWIGLRASQAQEKALTQKLKWTSKSCRFFRAQK